MDEQVDRIYASYPTRYRQFWRQLSQLLNWYWWK